ncbi:MAG TPA: TRZ/ATZ family protein [Acholeplasmataceae bacterium]|jgi:fumarate hydratase subunit beta|nr:TRZ/ATZ family protein [Acholeplasmataceae bacterium]
MKRITLPIDNETIESLKSGDIVLLTGTLYTARDAAHKRLVAALEAGEPLPFPLENAAVYYVGPSPARPGRPIGAAGPTTAARMDPYAEVLIPAGLKVMIGKGQRSEQIKELIAKHKGLYLTATGGVAALIARAVKSCELIAYPDLGPEAVYRLEVEDFPAVVAYDCYGNDLFPKIN